MRDFAEGKVSKGGINKRPTTPRPPPPKGQGGCLHVSKGCRAAVRAARDFADALDIMDLRLNLSGTQK